MKRNYQVLHVEDVYDGVKFQAPDGWRMHSVITTWDAGGQTHALFLLEVAP